MHAGALALSLLASQRDGRCFPQEAAKLGTTLTPLGAQKEGNADGSIPAWTGGLKPGAAPVTNGFLGDPFSGEKPLFTITRGQRRAVQGQADRRPAGHVQALPRHLQDPGVQDPPHRRGAAGHLRCREEKRGEHRSRSTDGNGLINFSQTPLLRRSRFPKNGVEVFWNHLTRYPRWQPGAPDGPGRAAGQWLVHHRRVSTTKLAFPQSWKAVTTGRGRQHPVLLQAGSDCAVTPGRQRDADPRDHRPGQGTALAWVYNAGQRRVRRAPQVAYDGPGTASDGMRTADNADMFNGAPDRYDWKLIGKKEMYIPYNNYRLHSPKLKYADILKPGHINQDLTRYELHRVWEVRGHPQAGSAPHLRQASHVLRRRHLATGRGRSLRRSWPAVAGGVKAMRSTTTSAAHALRHARDLRPDRRSLQRAGDDQPVPACHPYGMTAKMTDFTPSALRNAGIR